MLGGVAAFLAGSLTAEEIKTVADASAWLEARTRQMIRDCRRPMKDGTAAYPPQVGGGYEAFWLRDYAYILEGGAACIPRDELLAAARLFVKSLAPDGAGVDCVKFDGTPIYKPGYGSMGENTVADGSPFTVAVVYLSWKQTGAAEFLAPEMLNGLIKAMGAIPRDAATGLVFIDPAKAWDRCPYGFTDTIRKTGLCFFESLLDVEASRRLAELLTAAGRSQEAQTFASRAETGTGQINAVFWDPNVRLYWATTKGCRLPDIWGSALAVWLGVASEEQSREIAEYFKVNHAGLTQKGQVRQVPPGMYWGKGGRDRYQNGAFWGTPSGWYAYTLSKIDPALADQTLIDLVNDYAARGVGEWVFGDHVSLPGGYMSSATLPLAGVRRITAERATAGASLDLRVWRDQVRTGCLRPFSFDIGGRPAQLDRLEAREVSGENGAQKTVVSYRETSAPLEVALTCEFPPAMDAVRVTVALKATAALTNAVRNVAILDLPLLGRLASVHGQTGGFADKRDCFPPTGSATWVKPVSARAEVVVESGLDGRSSNKELPLWLYAENDGGIWYGPEWSGCWHMSVRPAPGGRRLQVGLPTFDFAMRAGETIVLPTAAFGVYRGTPDDGFNRLRHVIRRDYLPPVDGKKPQPRVYWEGYGGHPRYATEDELYREVDRAAQVGCEVFCLDGGWSMAVTGNWYTTVGAWDNQSRFPAKGVKAFGEYVKAKGMKFGVWIEPRAAPGCPLYDLNKNLFYPGNQGLMRLDLPEGSALFQSVFEQLIRDYAVDWVWLDFNVAPQGFWKKVEDSGRAGLIELGFYQGWYRAIEETYSRHPGLWVESCASGGRIIDLGQLRHSQSIWVADEAVTDDANRNRRHALNRVLPAVYIQSSLFIDPAFVGNVKPDVRLGGEHRFLTYFSGDFGFGQGLPFWKDEDIQAAAKAVALYKNVRPYLEGDYYHLLPMPASRDAWDGCQYHDPQGRSGIVLMYRLGESRTNEVVVVPRAVALPQAYDWSVAAGDASVRCAGGKLTVRMDKPSAALIQYRPKAAKPVKR